jgi:peptide-methionine (S)-S-oxide reductase
MKPAIFRTGFGWQALALACLAVFLTTTTSTMNAAEPKEKGKQLATIGGGCFWCTEAVYEGMDGIKSVVSGYAGGKTLNPTYKEICTGETGHAEVVQIEFDPAKISYEKILQIFFKAHDPTTLNRQGADTGTQYRSTIMYHDAAQKETAEKVKKASGEKFERPVVTEIVALEKFYPAEDYHQDYFRKNPNASYCSFVIRPKLDKLKKEGIK